MIKQRKCLHCKAIFYGTERAKFCSSGCRIKYWRGNLDKQALRQRNQAKAQSEKIDKGDT